MSTTTQQTAQALMDLSDELSAFSDRLDDYIKGAPDPFAPQMLTLRKLDTHIALDATNIAGLAVEVLAPDVADAIVDLTAQISRAKETLNDINNAKLALSLVGSVLSAAAAISTGNPLAAATAVLGLVDGIVGAIKAAKT